jgi:hypothetical protein
MKKRLPTKERSEERIGLRKGVKRKNSNNSNNRKEGSECGYYWHARMDGVCVVVFVLLCLC